MKNINQLVSSFVSSVAKLSSAKDSCNAAFLACAKAIVTAKSGDARKEQLSTLRDRLVGGLVSTKTVKNEDSARVIVSRIMCENDYRSRSSSVKVNPDKARAAKELLKTVKGEFKGMTDAELASILRLAISLLTK